MSMANLIFPQLCTDSKGVKVMRAISLHSLMLTLTNPVNNNSMMEYTSSHFYIISLNAAIFFKELITMRTSYAKKVKKSHTAPWEVGCNIWLYVNHRCLSFVFTLRYGTLKKEKKITPDIDQTVPGCIGSVTWIASQAKRLAEHGYSHHTS